MVELRIVTKVLRRIGKLLKPRQITEPLPFWKKVIKEYRNNQYSEFHDSNRTF